MTIRTEGNTIPHWQNPIGRRKWLTSSKQYGLLLAEWEPIKSNKVCNSFQFWFGVLGNSRVGHRVNLKAALSATLNPYAKSLTHSSRSYSSLFASHAKTFARAFIETLSVIISDSVVLESCHGSLEYIFSYLYLATKDESSRSSPRDKNPQNAPILGSKNGFRY